VHFHGVVSDWLILLLLEQCDHIVIELPESPYSLRNTCLGLFWLGKRFGPHAAGCYNEFQVLRMIVRTAFL